MRVESFLKAAECPLPVADVDPHIFKVVSHL